MSKKQTNHGQEPLPPLSDQDRDQFLAALERPARPMPDTIRKAKKWRVKFIVSDDAKSGTGRQRE